MDERVKRFRREALRRGDIRAGYSGTLRGMATGYARVRVGAGASVYSAARDLGLPLQTLRGWLNAGEDRGRRRTGAAAFRPVQVVAVAEAAGPAVRIRTASGLEVVGLDVESAARLLLALGAAA